MEAFISIEILSKKYIFATNVFFLKKAFITSYLGRAFYFGCTLSQNLMQDLDKNLARRNVPNSKENTCVHHATEINEIH